MLNWRRRWNAELRVSVKCWIEGVGEMLNWRCRWNAELKSVATPWQDVLWPVPGGAWLLRLRHYRRNRVHHSRLQGLQGARQRGKSTSSSKGTVQPDYNRLRASFKIQATLHFLQAFKAWMQLHVNTKNKEKRILISLLCFVMGPSHIRNLRCSLLRVLTWYDSGKYYKLLNLVGFLFLGSLTHQTRRCAPPPLSSQLGCYIFTLYIIASRRY